jgi:hypothetical protein
MFAKTFSLNIFSKSFDLILPLAPGDLMASDVPVVNDRWRLIKVFEMEKHSFSDTENIMKTENVKIRIFI